MISDYFTKLTEMFALPDIRAETVAEHVVRGWVKHYGCPREIYSDQGRQFVSAVFQEMCKLLEISKSQTTPLHPSSDGLVERMNRTVKISCQNMYERIRKIGIVMAYNYTPQESTGVSPHRSVYIEEMLIPLNIMTDELMEPNQNVKTSEYASNLKAKLKSMYDLVRGNLQKASHRQKKQYDCRIREHTYKVGDNVWRNQWQSPPGLKATIRRHWTGPWLVVEKLCDVLLRVKHSPSVVIHGDNMKHYHGDNKLNFQVLPAQETETRFPNIRDFVNEQTGEDRQLCSGESVERNPVNSENQKFLQGNDTGDNRTQWQPLQDQLSYLRSCDTQSKAYGTNKSNYTVGTDRMVEHSVSYSSTVNKQSMIHKYILHEM